MGISSYHPLESEGRSVSCELFRHVALLPSSVKCSLEFGMIDGMSIQFLKFIFIFFVLPACMFV